MRLLVVYALMKLFQLTPGVGFHYPLRKHPKGTHLPARLLVGGTMTRMTGVVQAKDATRLVRLATRKRFLILYMHGMDVEMVYVNAIVVNHAPHVAWTVGAPVLARRTEWSANLRTCVASPVRT